VAEKAAIDYVDEPDPNAAIRYSGKNLDPNAAVRYSGTNLDPNAAVRFSGNNLDPNAAIFQGSRPALKPPQALVQQLREMQRTPAAGPQLAHDTNILWEVGDGTATINTGKYVLLAFCYIPLRLVSYTFQAHRESGSVTVDLQTFVPGNSPVYTSICNGDYPTITSGRYTTAARPDLEAAGWTLTIPRGVGLVLDVDSVTSFTQLGATFQFIRLDMKDQR
jgi:hypothetical protein